MYDSLKFKIGFLFLILHDSDISNKKKKSKITPLNKLRHLVRIFKLKIALIYSLIHKNKSTNINMRFFII